MSVEAEEGASGVRALRGVWAWLRRGERAASLESLSSAGSARTASSFAFLKPPRRAAPPPPPAAPLRRPPGALPLHLKYGLPRDTSTLPPHRRAARPARRAASEYCPRRAAHVPGKRRAPPPPAPAPASLRRRAHKRPAPRPPSFLSEREEILRLRSRASAPPEMDSPPSKTRSTCSDTPTPGDPPVKMRPEKSFLRQMFENKFRNSIAEPPPTRVLPSISELDREAVAFIQNKREQARKENESSGSSIYTQTDDTPLTDVMSRMEEKEKLKEMLKEIKNSLPKRPKHTNDDPISPRQKFFQAQKSLETPTLPIGARENTHINRNKIASASQTSKQIKVPNSTAGSSQMPEIRNTNPILVTHRIIVMDSMAKENTEDPLNNAKIHGKKIIKQNEEINSYQPMKVSALFNPIYIPKNTNEGSSSSSGTSNINVDIKQAAQTKQNSAIVPDIIKDTDSGKNNLVNKNEKKQPTKLNSTSEQQKHNTNNLPKSKATEAENKVLNFNLDVMSHHSRRRELINQLEQSIARGDEQAAADAAVKLAQLKISCSVLSFTSKIMDEPCTSKTEATTSILAKEPTHLLAPNNPKPINNSQNNSNLTKISNPATKGILNAPKDNQTVRTDQLIAGPSTSKSNFTLAKDNNTVSIQVWVEDKEATRGPIRLNLPQQATLIDLRKQAETTLGLAARLQRWIVGNTLCNDDNARLSSLAGHDYKAPFYLCLVESDSTSAILDKSKSYPRGDVYTELMELEQRALVPNTDVFECQVCIEQCAAGQGVVLRECVHSFCRNCLGDVVRHSEEPIVCCPATECPGVLQEREVRGLVSAEDYERWLARGLAAAETGTRNTFHCRTPDCTGWAFCEPGVRRFPCPVCKKSNCVQCQAIHEGHTCEEYRAKLEEAKRASLNHTDEGTKALLESLISRGEALECPECRAIITKKWGCDWIKCSACKTEICWVTRGRRWGPGGRGDTSAGCRCGVDGRRCHPSCGYCH